MSLKEGIDAFVDAYRMKPAYNRTNIIANWSKFVGQPIADKTSKIFINDKKLFVRIESATLRNELKLRKSVILKNVNEFYAEDQIEDVIFI